MAAQSPNLYIGLAQTEKVLEVLLMDHSAVAFFMMIRVTLRYQDLRQVEQLLPMVGTVTSLRQNNPKPIQLSLALLRESVGEDLSQMPSRAIN
jgi:hypothetical protein